MCQVCIWLSVSPRDTRIETTDQILGKLRVAELFFDVPLDYSKPSDGTLRLFARSVSRLNKPVEPAKEEPKLPWLVYLQGGPGFGCAAPQNYGFVESALSKGYQVRTHLSLSGMTYAMCTPGLFLLIH
jgi:hypothetical protein